MSERALKIKNYYEHGLWKAEWVQNVVGKGLTQAEADAITAGETQTEN